MTITLFDADRRRSASAQHMAAQLIAPLTPGARETVAAIEPDGKVGIDWETREAVVLVRLTQSLAGTAWRVSAVLPGAAPSMPVAEFAPWSEAGATLAVFRPLPPPGGVVIAPFSLTLGLSEVSADGVVTPIPAADIAARLTAVVLEGILGRVLHVLGSEKTRIRRVARELGAMRGLDGARDHALDSHGADLGVARFSDRLDFDRGTGALELTPEREPDQAYRQRLRIYRPFVQPSRRTLLERLNGPGEPTDPNRGLLGGTGVAARFLAREAPSDIAMAIGLVATGGDEIRQRFLGYVRAVHLVMPGTPVPPERFVPAGLRDTEDELRNRLSQGYTWPADAAVAPGLAAALDLVFRCRVALGEAGQWGIGRAQDAAGGSRYELGLGVDLVPPEAAELDRMTQRLGGAGPVADTDAEIRGVLSGLAPRSAADDPDGRWLLTGCGLRTVHRLATGNLYLSHLPTNGMVITPLPPGPAGAAPQFEVRYHAPGDPGSNAVLVEALASAAESWAAQGHTPWTAVPVGAAPDRWLEAVAVAEDSPAAQALRSAGLPLIQQPAGVAEQLGRLPPELLQTIELPTPLAQGLIGNAPNASNELVLLLQTLREAGLSAALAMVTAAGSVLLVVGVIGLPLAGVNLGQRRVTGFRWYAVPLHPLAGPAGHLTPVGSRALFTPSGPGLVALVALGYARRGGPDPYECRVELPAEAVLDLRQYEYLMNLLDHLHPAGVEINTFPIRSGHVDLDGNGSADPLPPRFANHYRAFRARRSAGDGAPAEG